LRLHVEDLPAEKSAGGSLAAATLAPLFASIEQATGWQFRCEPSPGGFGEVWATPIDGGDGRAAARLVLAATEADAGDAQALAAVDLQRVRPLALALAGLLGEINRLRHAVWQREAELAAGVPVAARASDEPHLADRLEAVLKGGAEAVGCQAAGLYLLDENTSELKLRAAWGLPQERLMEPARPLRGAMADLEALVGHAVVLEDTSLLPHWRCPEEFPSAVCVPVASPSIPLGTLWVFSNRQRDFTPQETNLLEIIAGRLAADLEREMLLAAGAASKCRDKQFDGAARWLAERLPSITPLIDGYDLAGWTRQAAEVGGDFHDWSVLPDGRLALAVGDADGSPLEAALNAASLHAAIKAHGAYRHDAGELLTRINETLVTASPGDQRASLTYALLEPESGEIEIALAGAAKAILVQPNGHQTILAKRPPLGDAPDLQYGCESLSLKRGGTLLLVSDGACAALDPDRLRAAEATMAQLVTENVGDSADVLVAELRRLLNEADAGQADDTTVLVLKRQL
jgi:serine phosphatase RsbU (regulator of sigma subunit)